MKRVIVAAAISAGLAGAAGAAEFQPLGSLGMGGAGVARNMGAYASYWNPAGLAFADKSFTMTTGAGVGLRVSEGLADNVDRLAKFTDGSPSTFDNLKNLDTTAANPQTVGEMVNLLTVLKDLETQKGTLALNIDAAVGFQVKQFGFGLFVLTEGFGRPLTDLANVLPAGAGGAISAADLVTLAGTPATPTNFFDAGQLTPGYGLDHCRGGESCRPDQYYQRAGQQPGNARQPESSPRHREPGDRYVCQYPGPGPG